MSKISELIGPGGSFAIVGASPGDVTYTHSILGTFNVTKILRLVADRKVFDINLPPDADDLDQHRVAEIMRDRLILIEEPVLVIDCEDGTHLLIDGAHRIAARRRLGLDRAPARIAKLSECRPLMVQVIATRADGSQVDPLELDRAFLEDDRGRHNAPDGRPRPGSTNPRMVLPPRCRA